MRNGGDIGNTSKMYARAFFSGNLVDAVTLSPYMGYDTVEPFLQFDGKWAVILALTSNPSAADFEMQRLEEGGFLYEKVIDTSKEWGTADNIMYVVGATQARMLKGIRELVPDHFLLVPGVGAQGESRRGRPVRYEPPVRAVGQPRRAGSSMPTTPNVSPMRRRKKLPNSLRRCRNC